MNNIYEKNKLANMLLGKQKIVNDLKYRKLSFVEIIPLDGIFLVYNNLTKQLVEMNSNEISMLKGKVLPCKENIELIENWFLVPEEHNDIRLSDQLTNFAKMMDTKNYINSFVILPTTDCNARCFYCYEAGINKCTMDEITAVEVAEYIKRVSKGKDVTIRWFGGEPLYNYKVIDIICDKLNAFGITYTSMIVTNALLFDDAMILRAKSNWHLTFAQITLDGTEKIYNRTKNYINRDIENPFEAVLSNIEKLLNNEISVKIRLNMDKHNIEDLYELASLLAERFPNRKKLSVYAHLLFENLGFSKLVHTEAEKEELNKGLIEFESFLKEKQLKSNEKYLNRSIKTTACMADDDTFVLISPLGYLGKCEHFVDEKFFGHINSSNINTEAIDYWKQIRPATEECKQCICYPSCRHTLNCNTHKDGCNAFEKTLAENKLRTEIINSYIKKQNKN